MAFKLLTSVPVAETAGSPMQRLTIAEAAQALGVSYDTIRRRLKRGELQATRRDDGAWLIEIWPDMVKQPAQAASAYATKAYITSLCSQIDALYKQMNEISAERAGLTTLLRQMIEARESELAAWRAREAAWEQRLAVSEGAVRERDELQQQQTRLKQELEDARHNAAALQTRLEAAQAATGRATSEVEALRAELAEARATVRRAEAEQERIRAAFHIERIEGVKERRQLEGKLELLKKEADRGWLSRLIRGKGAF